VAEAAGAEDAAEKSTVWEAPALRANDDGDAVTPGGTPVALTLIDPENPFTPAALTVTASTGPPAIKLMDATLVLSEKSG
jgi:hypothetical protein